MENKEKIKIMKAKGMTIKDIKEILEISNHEIYEDKPKHKERKKPEKVIEMEATIQETNKALEIMEKQATDPLGKGEKMTKELNNEFEKITISSNMAVNYLTQAQERCQRELISKIDKPFKSEWEYREWQRLAIALQLSQTGHNDLMMHSKLIWELLIENGEDTERKRIIREQAIIRISNFLTMTFSMAREEMAIREAEYGDNR